MNKNLIITLLTLSLLAAACSQPSAPLPTETALPVVEPTKSPTIQPQPTATEERIESGFYTRVDGSWNLLYEDEITGPVLLPEDLTGGDLAPMQLVQYGYFAAYDAESAILTAYTGDLFGGMFRKIKFQLSDDQPVTCLPETVGDGTPITNIKFMPNNGKVSFPPGPGNTKFANILPAMDDSVRLVMVLDAAVTADAVNPLQQLAMICP
jgi:hypothetical protein